MNRFRLMLVVLKVTTVFAAALVAMDPTVKVALIAGAALVLANIPTFILGLLSRSDAKKSLVNQAELKTAMDGNFGRLWNEKDQLRTALTDKSEKLAHAEGHREGIEAADKTHPK
jgi:hypothetical protein